MNFKQFINSDYLKNNPLCGIGEYKDTLDLATGIVTRRIKKYVIKGDLAFTAYGNGFYSAGIFTDAYTGNGVTVLASHYTGKTNVSLGQLTYEVSPYIGFRKTMTNLMIKDVDNYTTEGELAKWLINQDNNNTPLTIWYVLAEPTTETITVPSGLSGIVEGYLIQDGTPTPDNPIYPTANTVEKWFDIPHYIHNTSTDTLTTLPADIYADGNNATVGLKGDMSQTGTPTPTTPIQPSECGDLETTGEHTGQYKIPILSANTTTNIYLGEVQSTRKIKKLVLTGQENWTKFMTSNRISFYINVSNGTGNEIVSTHFRKSQDSSFPELSSIVYNGNSNKNMIFRLSDDTTITDVDEYKLWLSDQYAAGTPVCVWYILATPETGIVNEALRKIGDYADEVSGITIPTIAGADTISVGTTLQPSEVSVTYKGWHPVADVHIYPDSSWMPTSSSNHARTSSANH